MAGKEEGWITVRIEKLESVIRRTGKIRLTAELLGAAGLMLACLLAACLLAVALDVALSMDRSGLICVDLLLAAAMVAALLYLTWVTHRNRYKPRRLARLIEARLGIKGNQVINPVDLASQPLRSASAELRQVSLSQGEALAATVRPAKVIDVQRLRKSLAFAALAVTGAIAAVVVLPQVFRAVIPRYLNPFADHPPFTLIEFDVRIKPDKVYLGQPAVVTATLGGPATVPDQANLVFVDGEKGRGQSLPMLRTSSRKFILKIERAGSSRHFYIDTPDGRSRHYYLKVHAVPTFERVQAEYTFPAYTGWPPSRIILAGNNDLRAIRGTTVTLTVSSNLPLKEGMMAITAAEGPAQHAATVLKPTNNATIVRGSFELRSSGRYRLTLTSADGVDGNEAVEGSVTCVADSRPEVSFLQPPPTVVAPAHWKVPVVVAARDDVAVRRIQLFRGINGWGPTPTDLKLKFSSPTYATAEYEYDLAELGARPGDVITYYASAHDVYPSAGHFSDTPTFVIRVISREEYLHFARQKIQMKQLLGKINEFLDRMAEIELKRKELIKELESLKKKVAEAGGKWSDQDLEKLRGITHQQDEYALSMKQLSETMRRRMAMTQLYDFEEAFKRSLAKIAKSLDDQANETVDLTDSYRDMQPGLSSSQAGDYVRKSLDQLRRNEKKMQQDSEQAQLTAEQMEKLRKADEMIALTEQILAIADQQRELADRLGQFQNKESLSPEEQIRARRMSVEQAELRRDLADAVKKLRAQAEKAKKDLPKMCGSALELAEAIERLNVLRDQDNAAALAQAGQGRYAHRAADSAATKLESLIRECKGAQGMMAAEDLDRALGLTRQKIANGLKQLSQARGLPGLGRDVGTGGGGYYGSKARISLMGPHMMGGDADAMAGLHGLARGRGTAGPKPQGPKAGAETLAPEPRASRITNIRSMPGVPVRYRPLAEAYFRRLADESK